MSVTGSDGSTVDVVRCGKLCIKTEMDEFVGVKFHVPVFRPLKNKYFRCALKRCRGNGKHGEWL